MALIDLSALTENANAAKTLGNLILVSPQRKLGIQAVDSSGSETGAPILFHTIGEEQMTLESDITDHYLEDNTAIQDQIALKPERFVVNGVVGELNNVVPDALKLAKYAAEKLLIVAPYTPKLAASALTAYNTAAQLYQTGVNLKKNAVATWESLSGGEVQTTQQEYFQKFYGHWRLRTLFTVQTPWAIFRDMAIESLQVVQSAETSGISDFAVTFKVLRFAKTQEILGPTRSPSSRAINQQAVAVNMGAQSPVPTTSLLEAIA